MLSRQFKALCRVALVWALAWAVVGLGLGLWYWSRSHPAPGQRLSFAIGIFTDLLMMAVLGAISALCAALALARAEHGRGVDTIPVWRAAVWGGLAGLVPQLLIILLVPLFGLRLAQLPFIFSPMGIGIISGVLAGGSVAIAKRRALGETPEPARLPAI